jgi:hypothetical protein
MIDMPDKSPDPVLRDDIQSNCGFIEEHQLRVMHKGSTDISPHALSQR